MIKLAEKIGTSKFSGRKITLYQINESAYKIIVEKSSHQWSHDIHNAYKSLASAERSYKFI